MNLFFTITSKFDTAVVYSGIVQNTAKAQRKLDAVVLADSNYFCPLKTGKLQQSAIINSHFNTGVIIWRTPYARKQYYDYHKPPYQPNPNACGKWFEAAKARYMKKWEKVANGEV